MDLDQLREQIDRIDKEIIERLNARVRLAGEIGLVKAQSGTEIYVPSREEEVLRNLFSSNDGPLSEDAVRAIYREVISASRALQRQIAVAYLGPEATFTHQAAVKNFGSGLKYQALETIPDVFAAVESGDADYGVAPLENSTDGSVGIRTLDMLMETDLKIVSQVYMPISHCLISLSPMDRIKEVRSKDNALGQCRQWLQRMLPGCRLVEESSTARAVEHCKSHPDCAAIASAIASSIYDVPVVVESIQDRQDNITRFLVIGKESKGPLGDGRDKSSFAFSIHDEVGALLRALLCFSARGINLTRIESRPSRERVWDYYFFADIIGHYEDDNVRGAIDDLRNTCPMVKWLGSYPNA